jgi:hypothetical protein
MNTHAQGKAQTKKTWEEDRFTASSGERKRQTLRKRKLLPKLAQKIQISACYHEQQKKSQGEQRNKEVWPINRINTSTETVPDKTLMADHLDKDFKQQSKRH